MSKIKTVLKKYSKESMADYEAAFIGNFAVYGESKMIELLRKNGMSSSEAREFLDAIEDEAREQMVAFYRNENVDNCKCKCKIENPK